VVLLLGLTLSACGNSSTPQSTHSAKASASTARTPAHSTAPTTTTAANDPATTPLPSGPAAAHTILATVVGKPVTAAEVRTVMEEKSAGKPLPDPPGYASCSAKLKEEASASEPSKEAAELRGKNEAQLRDVCRGRYEDGLRTALGNVIHNRWLAGEARREHIEIGERAVQEEFETARKSFKNSAEFETYLKGSGQTVPVMKDEIKLGKVADVLFEKAKSKDHPATAGEVSAFYDAHIQGFKIPDGRHVRILRTATEPSAQRAISELRSGKSFAAVVGELSAIAQPIRAKNGEVKDLKPHLYEEKPLNNAIFTAKLNRLYGPLKVTATHRTIASETNSGFFIFEVLGIVPGHTVPLSQVKATIAQQLTTQQKQRNLASFVIAFRRRWTAQTDCRPGYVIIKSCRQFKAPKGALEEDPYTL
jgi:PPIC-type PPIASE domain